MEVVWVILEIARIHSFVDRIKTNVRMAPVYQKINPASIKWDVPLSEKLSDVLMENALIQKQKNVYLILNALKLNSTNAQMGYVSSKSVNAQAH